MEEELDDIADGNMIWYNTLNNFYQDFEPALLKAFDAMPKKEAVKTGEDCPECGNPLVIRKGKYGEFTACSNYPKCKYVKAEPKQIEETQSDYLIKNLIDEDEEFSTLLFHTLKAMLIQEGVNIDPILQSTGNSIGKSIFEMLYDDDLDIFMDNIADFWQRKGLGELTFKIGQTIKITTKDCFECKFLPKTGRPACFLDTGIFEGLFTEFFNLPVSVIETQCYTMGDEKCVFEIEPKQVKSY